MNPGQFLAAGGFRRQRLKDQLPGRSAARLMDVTAGGIVWPEQCIERI
jgi:hypothetical protein